MIEQKATASAESKQPIVAQGTLFDRAELERLTVKKNIWEETTVKKSLERILEQEYLVTIKR